MSIYKSSNENQTLPSVCPLDCGDTCSLSVSVKNQQIVAVKGSKSNPYTAGVICAKVANFYPEFVHGPNRLLALPGCYLLRDNSCAAAAEASGRLLGLILVDRSCSLV